MTTERVIGIDIGGTKFTLALAARSRLLEGFEVKVDDTFRSA